VLPWLAGAGEVGRAAEHVDGRPCVFRVAAYESAAQMSSLTVPVKLTAVSKSLGLGFFIALPPLMMKKARGGPGKDAGNSVLPSSPHVPAVVSVSVPSGWITFVPGPETLTSIDLPVSSFVYRATTRPVSRLTMSPSGSAGNVSS